MSKTAPTIRPATLDDAPAAAACVSAAYQHYIARIGKPPGPMLDDYSEIIIDHSIYVIDGDASPHPNEDGASPSVLGLLVLMEKADGMLLDNIAVHPAAQGRGIGRMLMAYAETIAAERGHGAIMLYTHELMTENIALYKRLGYVEFDRRTELGLKRVYMRKVI